MNPVTLTQPPAGAKPFIKDAKQAKTREPRRADGLPNTPRFNKCRSESRTAKKPLQRS